MKVSGLSDNMTTEQVPSQQEEESVSMLAGMMDVDSETARRVLRKHKGDVEKAADAMLSGDKGDEPPPLLMWPDDANQETGFVDPFTVTPPSAPQAQVIDLTADDDDKTFQLSQAQNDVKFGPSQRAPNPSWQMVTTNTPVDTTHDDRAMNEAIQASLADMNASEDDLEMRPMEDSIRESGRPVALRTESSDIAYAALIVQALAQIPQISHHIATLHDPSDESLQRPEWCLQLVELFANLDLAQLSAIIDKEVLPRRNPPRWNGTHESLGSGSAEFLSSFAKDIDEQVNLQSSSTGLPIRLFQFLHAKADSRGRSVRIRKDADSDNLNGSQHGCVVEIQTGSDSISSNDLVSRLSTSTYNYNNITQVATIDVILEPSDIVAFQLRPQPNAQGKATVEPFAFPTQFYLDRFIYDNVPLTEEKRTREREINEEIRELTKKKDVLTRGDQGRDVLADMRATLYYYKHVAFAQDETRRELNKRMGEKLQHLLDTIISSVHEIDVSVEKLQTELATLYDVPELQKHLYDLRAVFMHTGLRGRKQIYSYIQDVHGTWWKTVDYTVTEVPEETALTDPTGLHLGAGPYLLLYSRHLPEEERLAPVAWPSSIANTIEDHNRKFFELVQPGMIQVSGDPVSTTAAGSFSAPDLGNQEDDVEMWSQLN